MTGSPSKTVRREGSQAQRPHGIPHTLLFFLLKQLETPQPGLGNQQDPLK